MIKNRIVFFGTSDFAVASLDKLISQNYNIAGVITIPDKPSGRGKKIQFSPVKKYALTHALPLLQPFNLKSDDFIEELRSLKADLQIVIAFRLLPKIVWEMPPLGTFNLHASLLPQYRGAAPINWAVINGEIKTGVTTFFLNEDIDTGKIIHQEAIDIYPNETAGELHDRLKIIGAELVLKTIKTIALGNVIVTDQKKLLSEIEVLHFAPKIKKENCKIDWNKSVKEIKNFIHGLSPIPAAFTEIQSTDNKKNYIRIFKAETENTNTAHKPGSILTDGKNYFSIAAADGLILIKTLQLNGKNKMNIHEFLRGFKIDTSWNTC